MPITVEDGNYISAINENRKEKDYTTFTVIRQPLDRLVSSYLEVCRRATVDSPETLKKGFYYMPESKARFLAFIDEIERDTYDAHVEPQVYYLSDEKGTDLRIDEYLILESLDRQFSEFKKKCLDDSITLIRSNSQSSVLKAMVYSYLKNDGPLVERINSLYAEDWTLYNALLKRNRMSDCF